MFDPARNILREALRLPANDRAASVEQLTASFDKADPVIDIVPGTRPKIPLTVYREDVPETTSAQPL